MDEAKRERVQDWLMKAFIDLEAARMMATGPKYLRGTAVYHCQQAAEKAVKGYLFLRDQQFDRTHDVESLVNVAASLNAGFLQWLVAAKRLTPYSVIYRYPRSPPPPTKRELDQALRFATNIYTFVLSLTPEETHPKQEQ
jgi:HEPN domain-containing protein